MGTDVTNHIYRAGRQDQLVDETPLPYARQFQQDDLSSKETFRHGAPVSAERRQNQTGLGQSRNRPRRKAPFERTSEGSRGRGGYTNHKEHKRFVLIMSVERLATHK